MADIKTQEERSKNMSHIRCKDTSIELKVRKYLFKRGFRYRKNVKTLPGKPDIVLKKYNTVIFVHGCYWHRHPFCKHASMPTTRIDFWTKKFEKNIANDKKHYIVLEQLGWKVIVIWECEIENNFEINMQRIINELYANYLQSKKSAGNEELIYGEI